MLFWLHVCSGQLLCLHDVLPCLCLSGAGGEMCMQQFGEINTDKIRKQVARV